MDTTVSAITADSQNLLIFKHMAPLNLCLSSIVLLQNTVIIMDFYAHREMLSSLLFILIAAADMLTAGIEVARSSVALTCIRENHSEVYAWLIISYLMLGIFSYNCSVFCNLVLTVVKAIHISNPFYQLQTRAIKIALVTFSFLCLIVCAADVFFWHDLLSDKRSCYFHWLYVDAIGYAGEGAMVYYFKLTRGQQIGHGVLLCSQYLVPSIIVLVCMGIQVYFIKKMTLLTLDARDSVHRAHYTVLLVSLSFFVCTCAYPIIFVFKRVPSMEIYTEDLHRLAMVVKYTLPLLNSLLFLLILVIRRSSIRRRNWECLQKLLLCPALVYEKLRRLTY